jgi:hypothetical protein
MATVCVLVCAATLSRGFAGQIAHDVFFSLTLAGCAIVLLSAGSEDSVARFDMPPLLLVLLGYFASGPLEMTIRLHPRTLD